MPLEACTPKAPFPSALLHGSTLAALAALAALATLTPPLPSSQPPSPFFLRFRHANIVYFRGPVAGFGLCSRLAASHTAALCSASAVNLHYASAHTG